MLSPSVEPVHHGADGCLHDVRDLLIGEALDISQIDRDTALLRQFRQRIVDEVIGKTIERLRFG